jgi:uncharacterized protein involved in tellurium resistance
LLQEIFTLSYIDLQQTSKKEKNMTSRGYTVEEGNRFNNFAIEPKVYVDDIQRSGFTEYAEKLNGRLAMIGFVSLLALEVFTGHGIVGWLTSL